MKLPSPAMVVALIALFVGLGGAAGAATTIVTTQMLRDNSVTRAKIAVNSVNSAKIEDGSIQSKDLAGSIRGQRGATGPKGEQGETGNRGATGPKGETGEAGLRGPAGTNGANGTNGATGTNGVNGTDGANGADGADGADGVNGISTAKVATPTPNWTGTYATSTGDLGQITLPAGEWLLIVTASTTGILPGTSGGGDGQISCSLKSDATTLVTQSTSAASRQSALVLTFAVTKAVSPVSSTTYSTVCTAYDTTISATTGLAYAAIKLNSITT
jgi:hypothetical protein